MENLCNVIAEAISGNIIQLMFAFVLIKYRREFGIITFFFIILTIYGNIPTVFHVIFYAITAILACAAGKDPIPESIVRNHRVQYSVSDEIGNIRKELSKKALFGDEDAINKLRR